MIRTITAQIRPSRLRAPIRWLLRNTLTSRYLKGWLFAYLAPYISKVTGLATAHGTLRAIHYHNRVPTDYGVIGYRVVTTALVNFLVDQLQAETSVIGDFKYHDAGVGTTAEAVGDTGIETTDGESRATGTQTESAANVYRSVATITYTSTKAITEHGLFNDASAGTLMDRTKFSAINVISGDSIEFTYDLTLSSGG